MASTAAFLSACAPNIPPGADNELRIGGGRIHIDIDSGVAVPRTEIIEWIRRGSIAVSGYLGWFPSKDLVVRVHDGGMEAIGDGVTHGNSSIDVTLGKSARREDLDQDWVITHEMFHLGFPTLDGRYLWMMEGLSDYLEPISRARAGQITAQDAWKEFVEGLPQGLPMAGDRGLDYTRTRERIYWGGNLYWLLADLRIREQTQNRHSVDDVIRAILAEGGTGAKDWPLEKVLTVGEKATGTTVLKDLHDELGAKPVEVNLDRLWQKLGIHYRDGVITFDDSAPEANIRRSITAR